MNANKVINWLTGGLVAFLSVAAFVLSYDALYRLALANGVTPALAWLWPLTLDAVMIAASLAVLRNSLVSERTWYQWVLVIVFTGLSVTFNALHAPTTWLARGIFALPPLVVFLAFELFTGQVKSAVKRHSTAQSLQAMNEAVSRAQADLEDLNRQADELSGKADTLRAEIAELRKAKRDAEREVICSNDADNAAILDLANRTRKEIAETRKADVMGIIAQEPHITYPALAQRLGVSLATVKRDISELIDTNRVKRNGHGLEVISSLENTQVSEPMQPIEN